MKQFLSTICIAVGLIAFHGPLLAQPILDVIKEDTIETIDASKLDDADLIGKAESANDFLPVGDAGAEIVVVMAFMTPINYLLTLIGIVFFVLMIYAGYIWMMARGNDQEIAQAQTLMRQAIAGLIVIIFARIFTEFIIQQLATSTTISTT